MASYTWRERVTRRVEYAVESGYAVGELGKAIEAARADYARRTGVEVDKVWHDDWARVEARDDEVVVAFDVAEPADANLRRLAAVRDAVNELLFKAAQGRGSGPDGRLTDADFEPLSDALNGPVTP